MKNYRDQDSTPSEKAFRFFALLLFNNRFYSLTELSSLLAMSKPAVSRMIRNFENAWIGSLQREQRGREIYIKLQRSNTASNIAINGDGLKQLLLCREFLVHMLPENMLDKTLSSITQAVVFTPRASQPLQAIPAAAMYKGKIDNTVRQKEMDNLITAIENNLVCQITYHGAGNKEAKTWFLAPKRLLAYHETIYIEGWKVSAEDAPEILFDDPLRLPLQRFRGCE